MMIVGDEFYKITQHHVTTYIITHEDEQGKGWKFKKVRYNRLTQKNDEPDSNSNRYFLNIDHCENFIKNKFALDEIIEQDEYSDVVALLLLLKD